MLIEMVRLKWPIDYVIFCDVGWEFPETIKTIEKIAKRFSNEPFEFIKIDLIERFNYMFFEHIPKTKPYPDPYKGVGFPSRMRRWCSRDKGRAIDKRVKKLAAGETAVRYIGFAYDEQQRANRPEIMKIKGSVFRFPLIEWKWNENKCLMYCYENGVDFEGFYDRFDRGGCWNCPLQPLKSLRALYKHYPKLWKELKRMQKASYMPFRMDKETVFDLDKRFKHEEKQLTLFDLYSHKKD